MKKSKNFFVLGILATTFFSGLFFNGFQSLKKQEEIQLAINNSPAKDFVDDLNNIAPGETYNLQEDIDLSELTVEDNINFDGITLNGNGHKIYNRTLQNKKDFDFGTEAESKPYYFFQTIENSTIKNLTFDNVLFPFYDLDHCTLINVNFENTIYEDINFTIDSFEENFSEDKRIHINTSTIGLFILKTENSVFNKMEIKNLKFQNNTITNSDSNDDQEATIMISTIGYIKEKNGAGSKTQTNLFTNIYLNEILFENNNFTGLPLFDWEKYSKDSPTDYGSQSSIVLSPTIGGIIGWKNLDSYAKVTSNYVILDDITFANNISTITSNKIFDTGNGQGIFYSLGSVINVGAQLTINNTYLFNFNVINDSSVVGDTQFLTGFITTLNNYVEPSKAFIKADCNYFYQENLLEEFLGFSTIIFQHSTYQTMVNNINFGTTTNGENWDENLWSKTMINLFDEKGEQTTIEKILYHKNPWIDSIDGFQYKEKKTSIEGYFRIGAFENKDWEVTITTNNNGIIYHNKNLSIGKKTKANFLTKELLDPTDTPQLNFVSGDSEVNNILDTTEIVPKITKVTNNKTVDNKVNLNIDFSNNFNFFIKMSINLYKKQNLIEKKDFTSLDQNGELSFITNKTFDENEDWSQYYYDINIEFTDINNQNQKIYDAIINYDNESLISFAHYKEKISWWVILIIVILIFLLIFLILLIVFFIKRRKNKIQMIELYEEVTGIQLV